MSTISLRHLARQYANGALDQASYRRARAEYLESVLNGNDPPGSVTQANYTSPKAVAAGEETITEATFRRGTEETQILWRAGDNNRSGEQDPHLQTQPIQLSDHSLYNVYLTAGIVAGVIVLLVGASLLFMGNDEPATSIGSPAATEQAADDQTLQPIASNNGNPALRQLKQFLDAPQWSQQALDDFANRWQRLPREQREAALDTTLARQLSEELFRQLQEERALQGLDGDDGNTLAGQQKIVDFARAIGLDDPRLEVTEAE